MAHSDDPTPLRWGILATGEIAAQFARSLATTGSGDLVAVGSRAHERAVAFAASVPASGDVRAHGSYEALVGDEHVDAVYVATPHPEHARWSTAALREGKAVLCEKPLTTDLASAQDVVAVARETGAFLMEAYMYRLHPQTLLLERLVREQVVGELRVVRAAFSFDVGEDADPAGRLLSPALGGGGILDVGGYPVSLALALAGGGEPDRVTGVGRIGPTGVDELALAGLSFRGGEVLAELACGVRTTLADRIELVGTKGRVLVEEPCWMPHLRDGGPTHLIVERTGEEAERVEVVDAGSPFALEADEVARHRADGESPTITHEGSLATMRVLDAWRAAIG